MWEWELSTVELWVVLLAAADVLRGGCREPPLAALLGSSTSCSSWADLLTADLALLLLLAAAWALGRGMPARWPCSQRPGSGGSGDEACCLWRLPGRGDAWSGGAGGDGGSGGGSGGGC